MSWSLYFSLPSSTVQSSTSSSLARPFLHSLRGRELKRRRVFECAHAAECDKLKCWLLIPERQLREDDMHCCSAKTSKFVYHLPRSWYGIRQLYYCVFFLAVSSPVHLCFYHNSVLQSICTTAAEIHKINICVADSKFILQNIKVIWGSFFSHRCFGSSVNLKKEYWNVF